MSENITVKVGFQAGSNPFPCSCCPRNDHNSFNCDEKAKACDIRKIVDLTVLPKLLVERFIQCGDPYNLSKLQKITKGLNSMIPRTTYKALQRLSLDSVDQALQNGTTLVYNPDTFNLDNLPKDVIVTKTVTIRHGKIGNVQVLMNKNYYFKPESLHLIESEFSLDEFKYLLSWGKVTNLQIVNCKVEPPPSFFDIISLTREATTLLLDIKNFSFPRTWTQDLCEIDAKQMIYCTFQNLNLTFDAAYLDKFIQERMKGSFRKSDEFSSQNHLTLKLNANKYEKYGRKKIASEIIQYVTPLFTRVNERDFRAYLPNQKVEIGLVPTLPDKGPKLRNLYFVSSRCLQGKQGTKRKYETTLKGISKKNKTDSG